MKREREKKEWQEQLDNGKFSVAHRTKVPKGAAILPAVWQVKRKRCVKTRQTKKWRARLKLTNLVKSRPTNCQTMKDLSLDRDQPNDKNLHKKVHSTPSK